MVEGPDVKVPPTNDRVGVIFTTDVPVVKAPVVALNNGAGAFTVKLLPDVVTVATPEGIITGCGILMLTELVPNDVTEAEPATDVTATLVVGTLMLYEFAPNVAVVAAPLDTTDAVEAGGMLILTELVPKEVTEAEPATDVTATLVVGTLML